jgi:tRNA G18 (ribose-2'-O)-methylase SpoU
MSSIEGLGKCGVHRYTKIRAMQGSGPNFSGFFGPSVHHLYGADMPVVAIQDADDPRLSDYVGLSDPDLRRRVEPDGGFFIAESPLVVEALIRSPRTVRSVLVTPTQFDALGPSLMSLDAPVYVARPEVLRRIVGFDLHRGAVAAGDRWPLPPVASVLTGARSVAVLERIADHENLGGLFRNAAAFGIDAVLLDAECADPLYRRCVRVSIGHVLSVPWTRLSALDDLRVHGFTPLALTPSPDAQLLDEIRWPERTAFLIGTEGPGLSKQWLAAADARVRIPIEPGVDSLNVATAAAIAFYARRA